MELFVSSFSIPAGLTLASFSSSCCSVRATVILQNYSNDASCEFDEFMVDTAGR